MKTLQEIPEWVALERAVSILGLGGAFDNQKRANKALEAARKALAALLVDSFTISPSNTYSQAFQATLAGHQIRLPTFPPDMSWVFERNHQELLKVYGDTSEDWRRSGTIVLPTGAHQLSCDWEVLPIIDFEQPVI